MVRIVSWAIVSVCVIFLAFQPIGLEAQYLFALSALGSLLLIHFLKLTGVYRHIFLAIGCTVALRYLYWRSTTTLPDIDNLASFIPGVLLFMAELYSISMLFISVLVSSDPVQRKAVKLTGDPEKYPSVDIFVPSYNEDDDILCTTLAACKNMTYPASRLNIYLLDDGGTDQKCNDNDPEKRQSARDRRIRLTKFCKELGVNYVTRKENKLAKAGNLNNGLENSNGDLVVVFDADHAPVREFLVRTIGHMQQNDRLFLVQTPHFFLNPDPIEKNLETFQFMPSENEMFYSVTQKGLDKWDASFFCGSGAVLRREALNEVGGFKGVSITEDCETALELHSRGWESAYVDEPLLAGFQPETVTAFLIQRSRWCQGMTQIMLLRPPFGKRGLNLMQKIAYISSMVFWLFPFSRLMFVFSPALFIFLDLEIYNASLQEFFAYTGIFMACGSVTQNYLYGKVRWPWISETYEYFQSFTLLRVIFSTVWNPRKPTFKVTDKGTSLDNDFFADEGWLFLGAHMFLIATFTYGLYRLHLSDYTDGLLFVVTFWAFFNVILGGLAVGACAERRERRRHYRLPVKKSGHRVQIVGDQSKYGVSFDDVAIGGFAVDLDKKYDECLLKRNDIVKLEMAKPGQNKNTHTFKTKVQWVKTENGRLKVGLAVQDATAMDRRVLSFLMLYDNSALKSFRQQRKKYRSVLHGTGAIMVWSMKQTVRAWRAALDNLGDRIKRKKDIEATSVEAKA